MTIAMDGQKKMMVAVVCLGAVWGSAFMLVKILVGELSPLQIVAGRVTLGAVASLIVLTLIGRLAWPSRELVTGGVALAIVDSLIPALLISWGSARVDSGQVAVLMSTMPIFTTLFSVALARERVSSVRALGVGLGFIGVFMLTDAQLIAPGHGSGPGMVAVLIAAAAHAAGVMYARRLLQRTDALTLNCLKLWAGTAIVMPVFLLAGGVEEYAGLSASGWIALTVLGVVMTAGAFSVYFWIVSRVGSIRGSVVTYIMPVTAMVLGGVVLGERLGPLTVGGGTLTIAGVACVMYRPDLSAIGAFLARLVGASEPEPEPVASLPELKSA
jgi:drug/metabolite transporter (DMT)-like permease